MAYFQKYDIGQVFVANDGTIGTLIDRLPNGRWKMLFENGSTADLLAGNVANGAFTSRGIVIDKGETLLVPTSFDEKFVEIDKQFSHLIPKGKRFKVEYSKGYPRVRLSSKHHRGSNLSRVIAQEIIGKPFAEQLQLDHIDRNPLNNTLSNLRFATNRMNTNNRGKASYLREHNLVSGGSSYMLSSGVDCPDGKTYRVSTPSIRDGDVVRQAQDWFASLLRQTLYTQTVCGDLDESRAAFEKIFIIAEEESKHRRPQDRSHSHKTWAETYGPVFDLAKRCEESDRQLIFETTGHPYGTTLKEILNG